MASSTSILSYSLPTTFQSKPCTRSQPSCSFDPLFHGPAVSKRRDGSLSFPADQRLAIYKRATAAGNKRSKMDFAVHCSPENAAGNFFSSFWPFGDSWFGWVAGLAVTLPLLGQRLLTLTKEVDTAAETIESIADAVENVAEEVDKMAEELSEKLPAGKLKDLAEYVEHAAEQVDKTAEKTQALMDKVEELVDEVDEKVESFVSKQPKDKQEKTKASTTD